VKKSAPSGRELESALLKLLRKNDFRGAEDVSVFVVGPKPTPVYILTLADDVAKILDDPFPRAVCTLCGFLTNRLQAIGFQCSKEYGAKRCEGLIISAPVEDWSECPKCSGTGRSSDAKCLRCSGWGWHTQRKYAS